MFPDYVVELVSMQRDGKQYAIEWVWRGTHNGPAPGRGLPVATHKPYWIRGASVGLNAAGKITVQRDWNVAGFLIQLGRFLRCRLSAGDRALPEA